MGHDSRHRRARPLYQGRGPRGPGYDGIPERRPGLRKHLRVLGHDRRAIYQRDRWQCRMPDCACPDGRAIDRARAGQDDPWVPSIDHSVPLAVGGRDGAPNKRSAHRFCNNLAADLIRPAPRMPALPLPGLEVAARLPQAVLEALSSLFPGGPAC